MNVFSVLIATLNSIPVCGEDNLRKMLGVLQTLRQMETAANEEATENGEQVN